jgi:tight adherence protein C
MDLDLALPLLATFGATVVLVLMVRAFVMSRRDPVRERLSRLMAGPGAVAVSGTSGGSIMRDEATLGPLGRLAQGADAEELNKLRQKLTWAGFGPRSMEIYILAKLFGALAMGGFILAVNSARPMAPRQMTLMLILMTAMGFYLPTMWLRGRVAARQRGVRHALPDALDLLVSCVEAGLGLDRSLDRVAGEIGLSAPVLAAELSLTSREMQAGIGVGEGFRRLAARTGVDELKSLAAILVQTEMFGTSIGKALRVLADALRVDRMQRANERAGTVAVRLTIPLVLCLMPSLLTVLMGGAAIRFIRFLLPTLTGHGR